MADNQIEEVKNKTDIVSLISEYIEVKKAGRNYKANCPFHGEKTPSFMITPELQIYKCFGCGRSGDVYTFIEEHEGMSFGEALKYLAEKAGVKLTKFKDDDFSEKEKIISINEKALNFYEYVLNVHPSGKKIIEYLTKDRGLKPETIKLFKIGYSPDNYDSLYKYLTIKQKFNVSDLVKAGLIAGRTMDRFKGRVVFPLFDHRDKVVGFSGRILPWVKQDMAKYINSPDTPAYHKSKMLYGLNITKQFIREKQIAIVVEGELDMISSFQVGIKNVIAIKGSALTEDHLRLIGRFCQKIILCLDSDFAGDEAAKRGAIVAVDMGFDVKVCELKSYKDPDDAARENPDEYKKSLTRAIGIWDFLINQIFEKYDSSTGSGKAEISKVIKPLLSQITDKIVQSYYVELVSRKLSVPTEIVMAEVSKIKTTDNASVTEFVKVDLQKTRRQLLEEKLLVNAIERDMEILQKKEILDLIETVFVKKVVNYINNNGMPLPKELTHGYAEMVLENSEADELDLIIKELKKLDLKEKREVLGEKIKKDSENEKLLKEFDELSKKLSTL
ncbi:MAG: DNA primase [bacterium]|nr:MAG: DNA primase [bacterium]